jgi:hypothetical protein
LVESVEELGDVLAGELPVQRLGDLVVVAREAGTIPTRSVLRFRLRGILGHQTPALRLLLPLPPHVTEHTIPVPMIRGRIRAPGRGAWRRVGRPIVKRPWIAAAAGLVLVSVVFVVLTGMRPEFDAYGWLVWGRQALHWDLDTNAAPSWKPLTFVFTFPYALAGRGALWLWMVTAVAGAFAGVIFAGRIAYRLAGRAPGRAYAPIVAAVFAGLGVLGIEGYWHLILISASDPMDVTLCLAAIDCHLSGRPRWAWVALVLVSLGRPEAWPLTGLYAVWAWRAIPSMRTQLAVGVAVIPALWFGIAALTSRSWFISSEVALDSTKALPGSPLSRVPTNLLSLYELPMQLAAVLALVLAVARRDRTWLVLAGAALVWLATETAFALHGWNPAARYMFEPAAVMIVLAGAASGWVLANTARQVLLRWAAIGGVVVLAAALTPHARIRARLLHNGIVFGHVWSRQIDRLHAVIAKDGGAKPILACGQAVTYVGFQSILAWEIDRNVADVGWDPEAWIQAGQPMVLFEPRGTGWEVRPIHTNRAGCDRLSTNTASS